jgi:hypothetical protein
VRARVKREFLCLDKERKKIWYPLLLAKKKGGEGTKRDIASRYKLNYKRGICLWLLQRKVVYASAVSLPNLNGKNQKSSDNQTSNKQKIIKS